MLCIALTLVFATSSAASVVDRFEHQAPVAHSHGLHLSLTTDDHPQADHDHDRKADGTAGQGHHPAAGHHHADAPIAMSDGAMSSEQLALSISALRHASVIERGDSLRPGGVDRPPRRTLQSV